MSTIMGIKTNNIVILGADKRLSTYQNKFVSDNSDKIIVVNNHLAIASAGNAAIQKAIEIDIGNLEKEKHLLFIEDGLEVIINLFKKLEDAKAKTVLSCSSYVILGGLDRKRDMKLVSVSYSHGQLQYSEAQANIIIFPPSDVSMKKCLEIYVENYNLYPEIMIEKTVEDISDISAVVSRCGNKWIYDNRSKQSKKIDF